MDVELSREAAHALYVLPLMPDERRQFIAMLQRVPDRAGVPRWAEEYLTAAAELHRPDWELGHSLRFTDQGMMTVETAAT